MNRYHPLFNLLAIFLMLIWCGRSLSQQPEVQVNMQVAAKLPPLVEDALWWLPEDTQTVVVTQGVRDPKKKESSFQDARPAFLEEVRGGAVSRVLAGKKVRLVVEGSRHFRVPKDLGLMLYEGASLVFFEEGLDEGDIAALHEGAAKTETICGHRVSFYRVRQNSDDWSIYIAHPKPTILIVATDRHYLSLVLSRMARKGKSRALPADIPEWKYLDPASSWWAIRHYDPTDVGSDPTTPLDKRPGWYLQDPGAIGLVVDHTAKVCSIKQISRSGNVLERVKAFWQGPDIDAQIGVRPEIRETLKGVVNIEKNIQGTDKDVIFLLILMLALGHGACI